MFLNNLKILYKIILNYVFKLNKYHVVLVLKCTNNNF